MRDVIQQRLRGAADHRDHVRALLRRRPRLLHVVVDVAGGDDHVLPGSALEGACFESTFALLAVLDARLELPHRGARLGAHLLSKLLFLGGAERGKLLRMGGEPLHCVQRVLPGRGAQGAPEPVRRASMQHARVAQAVDDQIRERRAPAAGAGDPEKAQHRPFDGHGGVSIDESLHAHGRAARQLARSGYLLGVDE